MSLLTYNREQKPGIVASLRRRIAALVIRTHAGSQQDAVGAYEDSLISYGAVKYAIDDTKLFRLRNGSRSKVYVDHGDLLTEPDANASVVRALLGEINTTFDKDRVVLVNVDSKSSPQLTGAIAVAGGFRQIIVLPEAVYHAENGTERRLRIPRELHFDDRIVIVDDVLTCGDQTAIHVARLVRTEIARQLGPQSPQPEFHLLVGLVRDQQEAVKKLEQQGIQVHWLTTLESLISERFAPC